MRLININDEPETHGPVHDITIIIDYKLITIDTTYCLVLVLSLFGSGQNHRTSAHGGWIAGGTVRLCDYVNVNRTEENNVLLIIWIFCCERSKNKWLAPSKMM